jgi:diacylglycerol kinase (ATP)
VANPNAGGGKGRARLAALEGALREAGFEPTLSQTQGPGHARRLTREWTSAGRGAPAPLVVVGGDGTLHEVVNGLRDSGFPPGYPVALLPLGTGNDFHRALRSGGGIDELIQSLRVGATRTVDVGEVRFEGGDAAFVNLLGVGIDVAVLERRSAFARLPGLLQYGAALFSARKSFRAPELRIEVDGRPWREGPTLLAAVTVGPSIGGGFLLSPDARIDDGHLDLFHAEPLNLTELLRHLPGVIRGTLGTTHRVRRARLTEARLESADHEPLAFELDGELMPSTSPWLEIKILPRALTFLDRV